MPNMPPKDNWSTLTGGSNPTPQTSPPANSPKPSTPSNPNAPVDNWDNIVNGGENVNVFKPPANNNVADIVQNMPNSDKLTASERWLYGKLPGFTQSTIGQALAKFGDSWAGKALSKLDIGAEGIERTVGLAAQIANLKPGDEFDLKNAWYAGSLFGDEMNLPTLQRDKDGKITGISIPNDLPGVNGLVDARKKIGQLVEGGMSESDALTKVRNDYYTGLGALSLRAQLYDTYFHVVADPLQYIMPALKPVE